MDSFTRRPPISASIAVLLTGLATVATPAMAGALPGSTFDIDIAGYNYAGTAGYYVVGATGPLQATFGSTQVFDDAGINGQNITVSSSESVGASTTTDTVIISTPTNFLTTKTIDGTLISALQFDIGDANADGVGISLSSAPTSLTESGYLLYNGGTTFTLSPADESSGTTLGAAEGLLYGSGGSAISNLKVNEFELSFTYANPVPEPASLGALCAGFLGLLTVAQRRRVKR